MTVAPVRYFGVWTLGLIGLNTVIGAGFFILPAVFFGHVGTMTPWLIAVVGCALLPIGFCFAEVGSRFRGTGGPYLYIRTSFGAFAGFEASWLLWITRVTAHASVLSAMTTVLGTVVPGVAHGLGQFVVILAVTVLVTLMNLAGTRPAAWFLNGLSVFKFLPILGFIAVGLWHVEWARIGVPATPQPDQLAAVALLMVFALGGFELVGVPAGEASNPQRHVPVALVTVVAVATSIMVLANLVTIGVLGTPSAYDAPIASAAGALFGPTGVLIIACTAVATAVGHNMGSLLVASRILYGMGEHGDLPRAFGKLDRRFRVPMLGIAVSAAAIVVLAASNSYVTLATLSGLTRLLIFAAVCAATLRLRSTRFSGDVAAPLYRPPLHRLMPWIGMAVPLVMLAGLTRAMLLGTGVALLVGAVFYGVQRRFYPHVG